VITKIKIVWCYYVILKRPQEIDEAARRRLVKRLYIPLPDAPARKQIVLNLMKQQPFLLSEDEIENICLKSEGNKIKSTGEQAA